MNTLTEFLLQRIAEDESHMRYMADHVLNYTFPARPLADSYSRRVMAECEAKRLLIADLNSERHEVVEDCWYTCAAATEEHDGGDCCDDSSGDECNCGRDNRVARRLAILALPYAEHRDYREEWAV